MATFNVDSLDFVDDEEARFGADADFATRFDSVNARLELEDLTNATVGFVPQNVGTDLVGGKFAETVAEGKALADDGSVYDTIQQAVNSASSWVKVGPGDFRESVTIDTAGLTLEGSGELTKLRGISGSAITLDATDIRVTSLFITTSSARVIEGTTNVESVTVDNVVSRDTGDTFIFLENGSGHTFHNIRLENIGRNGINMNAPNCIISNCVTDGAETGFDVLDDGIIANSIASNCSVRALLAQGNDNVIIGNRVTDSTIGVEVRSADTIVANNRISNSSNTDIDDRGTGTVLNGNLTT